MLRRVAWLLPFVGACVAQEPGGGHAPNDGTTETSPSTVPTTSSPTVTGLEVSAFALWQTNPLLVPLVHSLTATTTVPTRMYATFTSGDHVVAPPSSVAYTTDHAVEVYGLRVDSTYDVAVRFVAEDGAEVTYTAEPVVTEPLPDDFPTIVVHTADSARMEPGFTMMLLRPSGAGAGPDDHAVALDETGQVVWYFDPPEALLDIKRLPDGRLAAISNDFVADGGPITEWDFSGHLIQKWVGLDSMEVGIRCGVSGFHHEVADVPGFDSWVSLSKVPDLVGGYPSHYEDPSQTHSAEIDSDVVFTFDPDSPDCLPSESLFLSDLLDTTRIGFGALDESHAGGNLDWSHANGVVVDPVDGGSIVSVRNQDAVVKIQDGEVAWILGNHDGWGPGFESELLTPVGDLEWQYHQHSPAIPEDGSNRVLVFDNGDSRTTPYTGGGLPLAQRYSRLVEFEVDPVGMTVAQTWELRTIDGHQVYSADVGSVAYLPQTGNVLGCFCYISQVDGMSNPSLGYGEKSIRLLEVPYDAPDAPVFDVEIRSLVEEQPLGWVSYRVTRFPGFY